MHSWAVDGAGKRGVDAALTLWQWEKHAHTKIDRRIAEKEAMYASFAEE